MRGPSVLAWPKVMFFSLGTSGVVITVSRKPVASYPGW